MALVPHAPAGPPQDSPGDPVIIFLQVHKANVDWMGKLLPSVTLARVKNPLQISHFMVVRLTFQFPKGEY